MRGIKYWIWVQYCVSIVLQYDWLRVSLEGSQCKAYLRSRQPVLTACHLLIAALQSAGSLSQLGSDSFSHSPSSLSVWIDKLDPAVMKPWAMQGCVKSNLDTKTASATVGPAVDLHCGSTEGAGSQL